MPEALSAATPPGEKALFYLMGAAILFVVAFHVSPLWGWSFLIWFEGLMAGLAAAALFNAALLLGLRNALVFMAIAAFIGYAAEQVGIWTGWIFGPYVYTDKLGFKLIDVPWVIPLCWFGVVYFAHVITNVIIHAHPAARDRSVLQLVTAAALTALIATGLDMALDPAMSHPEIAAWIWTDGGDYLGVPFRNFQGWVVTVFLIDALVRLLLLRDKRRPVTGRARSAALWSIGAWAGLGFGYMLIGLPVATQLVTVFTVMLPAALALAVLYAHGWRPAAGATTAMDRG